MAVNIETSVPVSTKTNADDSFPDLPMSHYNIQIQAKGFSKLQETGAALDVNTALRPGATLQLGTVTQQIEVSANAAQFDAISTQLGAVIGSTAMTSLPLNGRSYANPGREGNCFNTSLLLAHIEHMAQLLRLKNFRLREQRVVRTQGG